MRAHDCLVLHFSINDDTWHLIIIKVTVDSHFFCRTHPWYTRQVSYFLLQTCEYGLYSRASVYQCPLSWKLISVINYIVARMLLGSHCPSNLVYPHGCTLLPCSAALSSLAGIKLLFRHSVYVSNDCLPATFFEVAQYLSFFAMTPTDVSGQSSVNVDSRNKTGLCPYFCPIWRSTVGGTSSVDPVRLCCRHPPSGWLVG